MSAPWSGPVHSYHGAGIRCGKVGHVGASTVQIRPLDGATFGVVGIVAPLVDLWSEGHLLPACAPCRRVVRDERRGLTRSATR